MATEKHSNAVLAKVQKIGFQLYEKCTFKCMLFIIKALFSHQYSDCVGKCFIIYT